MMIRTRTRNHLLIRADASPEIGLGHVMRCLALAQAWKDRTGEASFLCAALPASLSARIEAEGFRTVPVNVGDDTCADASRLVSVAEEIGACAIVVDGYQFDSCFYEKVTQSGCTTLCVDDFGNLPSYESDFILNQNLNADATLYARRSANTRLLLGTTYALLRHEFLNGDRRRRINRSASWNVLITLGGADRPNVTRTAIEAVKGIVGYQWRCRVIVGSANRHIETLRGLVDDDDRIELLSDVADMADQYQWADVAITAGGSTNWEMCYFGLPRLVLVTADNQIAVAEALHRCGAAHSLGDCSTVTASQLQGALETLIAAPTACSKISLRSMALVDGKGAARCAQLLAGGSAVGSGYACGDGPCSAPGLAMRPATMEDAQVLLDWRNDPQTRAVSRNSSPIQTESHLQWLSRALADEKQHILIVELDGQSIGTVRFDLTDVTEMSWTVAPPQRGKGLGSRLVAEAVKELHVPVSAVVKTTNTASRRVAENAGFQLAIEDGDWLTYLRYPNTHAKFNG